MAEKAIEWEAPEHSLGKKSSDWYWAVGIITISAVVTAIIFHNILFAIVILLGSGTLTLFATKEASVHRYGLSERGVHIEDTFYPFSTLESFWIEEHMEPRKVLIKSSKFFMPYLVIPLSDEVDTEDIRSFLLFNLMEVEHHESVFHKLLDYLGF